jgi:hypothetical protein
MYQIVNIVRALLYFLGGYNLLLSLGFRLALLTVSAFLWSRSFLQRNGLLIGLLLTFVALLIIFSFASVIFRIRIVVCGLRSIRVIISVVKNVHSVVVYKVDRLKGVNVVVKNVYSVLVALNL